MAIAKQCDICGKLYPMYGVTKDSNNPNGFMFLNIDAKNQHWSGPSMDCCPECIGSIKKHIASLKGETE